MYIVFLFIYFLLVECHVIRCPLYYYGRHLRLMMIDKLFESKYVHIKSLYAYPGTLFSIF